MKKAIFPRFVGLFILYAAVLAGLILIQFTKRSSFTQRIGGLVVSGYFRDDTANQEPPGGSEYALTGDSSVFFGGMEFRLSGNDGFTADDGSAGPFQLFPESMAIQGESVVFRLSDGSSLEFATSYSGGNQELRISAAISGNSQTLEIPYRPLRSSRSGDDRDGQLVVISGGEKYTFMNSRLDHEERKVVLARNLPTASYGIIPERLPFAPADYTVAGAENTAAYNQAVGRWRDQAFSVWTQTVGNNPSEDLVTAYLGESILRGTYKSALAAIPGSFLNSGQRTYNSSVYLGRLDTGLRTLSAYDREFLSRVSRQINEKSMDFLKEIHVVHNLSIRGAETFITGAADMLRTADPAAVQSDTVPGLFEGWIDWNSLYPGRDNPFDRFLDQGWFIITESMQKSPDGRIVFTAHNGEADTEYNLRLGDALARYGLESGRQDRAAIGRSLVLSMLSLAGDGTSAPVKLQINDDGTIRNTAENRVESAKLYHIFNPGEYYPRGIAVPASHNGVWAWTAASAVIAEESGGVLNIAVSFPPGETHHMIIRGVRPFTKIQLYNMDYRTDPQFERYDSSGWAYSPSEQTLIVKMKHRSAVENIRIFQ
ncbi:hypothetical protein [Breznakiella homolactica]|uniref:Uncharacterized protein n=1 Tax=Breznakiella homolactica TaxID=2798577 RepID=A0A7T8BAA9_9SPIR|nr:hypothetical protein [Breznakiella homolactica]QQO10474.1 hypothetical protein JFL75_06045 [Breznakiella homolactica]